jgi:hypothetical protein
MINRKLTDREKQIYEIIPDQDNVTFRDIVNIVRRDVYGSVRGEIKELKHMGRNN